MAKILPTLEAMILDGTIPLAAGAWIDIYNHTANEEIAGTIHTRISHGNYWYVTELEDSPSDGERLH